MMSTFGEDRERMDGDPHEPEGRWRVFTDGSGPGTRVIGPNGYEVKGVASLNFDIDARGVGHLTLEVMDAAAITATTPTATVRINCVGCGEMVSQHTCSGPPF
jgi:hypothetical protein